MSTIYLKKCLAVCLFVYPAIKAKRFDRVQPNIRSDIFED